MHSQEQWINTNNERGESQNTIVAHLIKLTKERGEAVFSSADDFMDTYPDEVG